MRHLICALSLLLPALPALPAKATMIDFAPSFVIAALEGAEPFTIENFSIVSQSTTNSASGSGSAVATINDFDSAEIAVSLGSGPGEAEASLVNIATFDLVFEEPVEVGLEAGFGINGPLQTEPGDSSFANWDISIEIDGPLLAESQQHSCVNGVAVIGVCSGFFDDSIGQFPFQVGSDLRLRVTTTMRFDIGVSRAGVVSEPGALAIMLLSLVWIGRRSFASSRS